MNIVMVAPEMVPFSKVGGLGDVLGALPQALAKAGAEVTAVIPHLPSMDSTRLGMTPTGVEVRAVVGGSLQTAQVLVSEGPGGVRVLALVHPPFFHREGLYGTRSGDYPDNAQRFTFFSYAALEAIKSLVADVDIVHTHDWQTGLVPALIKGPYTYHPMLAGVHSVFTVHNLGYQGIFPAEKFPVTTLSGADFFHIGGLEFWGKISLLKAGLDCILHHFFTIRQKCTGGNIANQDSLSAIYLCCVSQVCSRINTDVTGTCACYIFQNRVGIAANMKAYTYFLFIEVSN